MEEIKKRLAFDDISIRSRCIQKLVQIVKRKSRGELLTSSSVQIPELNLIWETCMSDSAPTSNLAVQAIIYLTTNRHLEIKYAISKLLGSLSSTNHAYSIVKGISKLLFENNQGEENNPNIYSLHQQRHPLIAVLQKSDDYLPLIFESIAEVIKHKSLRGFQVMEPVICYILSNPSQKKRNDYSKTLLLETLIEAVKNEPQTAFYILRCIPFLQVETYQQVVETSNFILSAKRAFANWGCEENERMYISELLLLSSLSLIDRSLDVGFNPARLFEVAIESCLFLSKSNYSTYSNTYLILLSLMLKKSSGELLEKTSSLALLLLDFKKISPTASAFLAFTVIQLLPEASVISYSESTNSILSQLLQKLENILSQEKLESTNEGPDESPGPSNVNKKNENFNIVWIEAFTLSVETSMLCAKFAVKLDGSSSEFKLNWLKSILTAVKSGAVENFDVIFSLVAALFLMSPDDPDYLNTCLETFEAVLQKNSYLSTKLFAVLLYKQNLLSSNASKLLILEFLPKSTAHKHSIPPVLSMLKMMSNILELKPKAIHLMLQLWKKHDRCFSYLHKLLLESNKVINRDIGVNGTLISQTAAIKEICDIAPEKRGIEFLGILSKVINESNDEATTPAVCLALDGVISLCKSEITDLRSTWKVLGPRLAKDKRTVVMCRMFKLLALIPDFPVKSSEFDKYLSEMVSFVWKRLSAGSMAPEAICCAYETLAKFPMDCHVLKQLPSSAKENLELPISMKTTPFEMGKLPEDVLTYIPGDCFIDLLKSLDNDTILKGYIEFLTSLVEQEVTALPRSVYNPRKHLQKRQNTDDALSKVPKVLCGQFEARRSLTLQRNLAVGVLLCYEPPLEMGKDGEPIKRSIATQCRLYEQVLGVLLNEVNIDTTEWQRCILIPNAWADFMERAFLACEESRKAELELQKNLGHREFTPDEFSTQCKTTWLWVRDRLLNLIKTSVKNAATSHANAVFAVSGLVQASHRFRTTLDDATKVLCDENGNYALQQTFEEECTETIMCATMTKYQPVGKVHSWLLTHLSRPNSSTAYLIRGCGCCALSHLTSVLPSSYEGNIPQLFEELVENLSHNSPVLSFYSGVGLGLFTKSLFESGCTERGESLVGLALDSAKQIQNNLLKEEDPSLTLLISLTMIMTSLSQIDHEESKDWVSTTCNLYQEKLRNEDISSVTFEALSVCVSTMIISAAEGACVPVDTVLSLASWFDDMQAEQPKCSGISVSYGMMIEALERFGHSRGTQMKGRMQKEWFNTVSSEKKNTLHRIAALNGLCSLYSCGRGLLQTKRKAENSSISSVNELLSFMFQMLNAERDTGLQNICSWEVGRLFSVHCFKKDTDYSVPSTYSYLGDKSILKPLVLAINLKKSNPTELKSHHILACLTALSKKFPRPLPPLNWNELLTPFLEQNTNPSLVHSALSVAIHQAGGSPYASSVLASYCCPPLFHSLPENCQILLFQNIPELVSNLPPHKLKIFLQTVATISLKPDPGYEVSMILQGIQEALKLSGQKQQTINTLHNAVFYILKQLKKNTILLRKHIEWISSTLSYFPEKKVESILSVSTDNENLSAVVILLCYLIRSGQKALSSLRVCVEEGKHVSPQIREQMCAALYECFLPCENNKSEVNQPEKCMSWLLQIIGWINVLNDSKSQYQLMAVSEVFLYLNEICMAVIIGCSGLECSYNLHPVLKLSHSELLENLPVAISRLILKEEWLKNTDKLITWLLMIFQSPHLKGDKTFIKLSLYAVRGSSEFQDLEVWTNVVRNIY